jgi:outer membrane immunogenic protein
MRRFVVALLSATAMSVVSANAADLPVKAPIYKAPPALPYNWTGFYVGGNAGYGWINDSGDPFCIAPGGVLNGAGCVTNNVPGAQVSPGGFIGGGQIGYNYQINSWLLGVEADFQGADIDDSISIAGPFAVTGGGTAAGTFTASERLDWLGTVRGRVGWVWDQALLYATGGLAYGHVSVSQNTIFAAVQYPSSTDDIRAGWTAGGGLEYAFAPNWSVKVEGLYYDLGTVSTQGVASPAVTAYVGGKDFSVKGAIVRAGINYRF